MSMATRQKRMNVHTSITKSYVISLTKPTKLLNYLDNCGLQPTLVRGIYGKTCPLYVQQKYISPTFQKWGPKSAIGCAMSHMKAWQMFVKSRDPYCIILEDDVVFVKNFAKKLKKIARHCPRNFDIVYLGCFGSENQPNFFSMSMSLLGLANKEKVINKYIKIPSVALGAHAYVLSKNGACKLLQYLYGHANYHIDYCLQMLSTQKKIMTYVTTPRLAYQTSSDSQHSFNKSSSFPLNVQRCLSSFYVDRKVRADWLASISIARLGYVNVNMITLAMLFTNITVSYFIKNKFINIIAFACIIMPDLLQLLTNNLQNINDVTLHTMLFASSLL